MGSITWNLAMQLETKRLLLIPLTESDLRKFMLSDYSLEDRLKLKHNPRIVTNGVINSIENKILPKVQDPNMDSLFYTLWSIIDKENNTIVANICFKGEPNENGESEIGYETYEQFQGNGFMTEAIAALQNWARNNEKLNTIGAITNPENEASMKVLKRNSFQIRKETQEYISWFWNS